MSEQGSEEWHQDRLGKVTASKISDVMAKGQGKTRASYMRQLICERLTGLPHDSFKSEAMERGHELEAQARAMYTMQTGADVSQVGFIVHPDLDEAGASPDGLVGENGLWECKCPLRHNHLEYLQGAKPPRAYMLQMQWQMACTGRDWCDFQSFCPDFPMGLDVHIQRVFRDDDMIREIDDEVTSFLAELRHSVESVRALSEAA